jgi:N,N'-diacetyllegionaminate synthase
MIENKTFIIAEAGVNHNGSIQIAKKMIEVAKECGAYAIKFQTFKAEKVISRYAPKAEYQKQTTGETDSQLEMVKKLELSFDDFIVLKEYCDKLNIMFLSTPFDFESIDFLNHLGLEIFKIPSGEITNLPYLEKIGRLGKKVILSTGMADLGEIEDALDILTSCGTKKEDITILHCNTEYPTPYEDVNLLAMLTIKEAFKVKVGYSDHTLGIEVPIAAVAIGASVIEKHFTLDKNMEGPDHKASLEPHELKAMIDAIRNIEKALGNGIKKPSKSELKNKYIARKSIVAKREIKKGEIFTEDNITVKRPGNGISPMRWYEVLGKVASRDYKEDELIEI